MSDQPNSDLFFKDIIQSYVASPRFVKRSWLAEKVDTKLADPNCRFVLLTGEPGAGKSAFMAWLAHQHLDWCRYFIRRDQRTPFSDVGSHSFLLQVGFQLAAIYPDLFKKEQIKIVVEQRIRTATNSYIVAAEIDKMFASPFYKKVIEIQQQVTSSTDSNIIGVHIEEVYRESRDLPLENLQFMALFDPAKARMKQVEEAINYPQHQIVVLIDALDELRYRDTELTLLKWLADCPELPSNLRFILTSRPDDDLLRNFRESQKLYIRELKIEEDDVNVEKDLSKYTYLLVEKQEEVKATLAKINQDVDTFVTQAVKRANGNFGYLDAIGRAIDQAIGQPKLLEEYLNLSQLPENLQDLYAFFLTKIKSAVDEQAIRVTDPQTGKKYFLEVWSEIYQPILGILSVAFEPLTLEQIQRFGDVPGDWQHLVSAVNRLRQFLDKVENCYRLYHSTLPEFFTSPKTKVNKEYDYCYVNAIQQNQCIVNYYRKEATSWTEINLREIAEDDYGRRYLASHLVQAAQQEELHTLLAIETTDRRNAWFNAKNSKGDTLGFLADVALAWKIAEQEFTTSQSTQSIVLQSRYALITSSINSLSGNLPTELVIELLKKDSANGLAYFQQLLSSQEIDLQILSKLEPQALNPQLVQKLLQVIEEISSKSYQTQVKCALAQFFKEELLDIFEKVKKEIKNEEDRNQALRILLPYLSLEQLSKALEVTEGISDKFVQAETLSMLPQYFQQSRELFINVLERAKTFYGQYRADILIGLAPYLPQDLLPKALEIALDDPRANEYSRTRSLSGLATAPKLNADLVEKIQKAAEAFQQNFQTLVLSALAPHLPLDQLDNILERVQALEDESDKSEALSALAPHLPLEQLEKILEKVEAFENESDKSEALSALAPHLPLEQLEKILEKVEAFKDESHKSQVLSALIPHLPLEQLEKILEKVEAFEGEDFKALTLVKLATTADLTADLIENIQQQIEAFQNKDNKTQVLSFLAMHLPSDQLHKILQQVQAIDDDYYQTKTLRHLLAQLPSEQLHKVLQKVELSKEIQAIDYEYYKDLNPGDIKICLLSEKLHNILQEVEALEYEFDKALALRGLASTPNLTADLIENIQQQVEVFQNKDNKTLVLSTLAKHLPSDQLPKILQEIHTNEDEYHKAEALSTLAFYLPSDQIHKILQEIHALDDNYFKIKVLSTLAYHLYSNQLHNQLHKEHKTQVLSVLAPHLASDQLNQVLQEIQTNKDESFKALALSALVPHLTSEKLQEVLNATLAIDNDFDRADGLRVIGLLLLPSANRHNLWIEMIHILASRNRRSLLSDFRELAPVIYSLGKDEAIVNVCHAIKDIGRQWP
jgi:hypothetical protein